jgi:hypothetical protein
MIAVMLLVSDVMFGLAFAVVIASATALAFGFVWALLPLRRRRRILARNAPPAGRP